MICWRRKSRRKGRAPAQTMNPGVITIRENV
jgi:hypothetical protein